MLAGEGAAIDTTTAAGKLVFGIFAALAEFERALIIERTKAGIAAARARGRKGGAPFKMTTAKLRLAQAAMGKPGNEDRAALPRTRHHPADALPPRRARWFAAGAWREAARPAHVTMPGDAAMVDGAGDPTSPQRLLNRTTLDPGLPREQAKLPCSGAAGRHSIVGRRR